MSFSSRVAALTVAVREKLNTMIPRLLPEGGARGEVLVKKSNSNFETEWTTVGSWPPITTVGTGSLQHITLPEVCTEDQVMVFVKGVFQHTGYFISDNILVTTQPAGFEIIVVRYGAGPRGQDGIDSTATVDSVLGLKLVLSGKADYHHTHEMSDITGLQEELNELADQIGIAISDNMTYEYTVPTASATWTINHNLGRFPSVTCVDSAGTVFFGRTSYVDINTVKVEFLYATDGKAYLV